MISPSGIEVYNKPFARNGQSLRFPELDPPLDDDEDVDHLFPGLEPLFHYDNDKRYKRCFIPYSDGPTRGVSQVHQ